MLGKNKTLVSKHCYYNMCLFNVLGHAYHDLYVRIATPNLQQTSKLIYNKGGDKCMDLWKNLANYAF